MPEPEDTDQEKAGIEGLEDVDLLRLDMSNTLLVAVIQSEKFTKAQFDNPKKRAALVESCAQMADQLIARTMQYDLPDLHPKT